MFAVTDLLLARDQTEKAIASELNEVHAALSAATQSLDRWQSHKERWEQDRELLTGQLGASQKAAALDRIQITELQRIISALQSENSTLRAQVDVTRSMVSEAEKQQQAMLKTLSAEFAVLFREARSIEQKSPDTP